MTKNKPGTSTVRTIRVSRSTPMAIAVPTCVTETEGVPLSMPELVEERLTANPFGAAATEEWSLAAIGMAAVAFACFEPGPAIEWGPERVAMLRKALATLSAFP
jgi:hypothetical protein